MAASPTQGKPTNRCLTLSHVTCGRNHSQRRRGKDVGRHGDGHRKGQEEEKACRLDAALPLPIAEIKEETVVLKNGGIRAVLKVNALNFNLKSEIYYVLWASSPATRRS